jgi:hypothetical protein
MKRKSKPKQYDLVENPDGTLDIIPRQKASKEDMAIVAKMFVDCMTEDEGRKPS